MNPAMEIARSLATALDLPLRPGALLRLRETPRQAGLGRRERRAALAGVFRGQGVPARGVGGRRDDHGQHRRGRRPGLLAAGALSVIVLAVARTPGRGS